MYGCGIKGHEKTDRQADVCFKGTKMVDIHVVAEGLEQNKDFLNNLISNHDEELKELLRKIGEDIVNDAKQILMLNDNVLSARLINSIEILEEGNKVIVVGTKVPYAGIVEFGRGPVRPITAKTLHWIDPRTGKDVFSRYSGPVEAMPFLQPAVEKNSKIFGSLYTETVENRFL